MMDRLITTHTLRKTCEPTPLWSFAAPDAGGLGEKTIWMDVPGCWESVPGLENYRGRGVYSKELTLAGNVRFVFGGAAFRALVTLDGREIARHYGAYTAFGAVCEGLEYGRHTLTVTVDNRFGDDSALHVPNDYYVYGGLTRPVTVEQLGTAWVKQVRAAVKRRGRAWQVEVTAELASLSEAQEKVDVTTRVAGAELKWQHKTLPARGTLTLTGTLLIGGVKPWSPESPSLYAIETTLWQDGVPADDLVDRIGFREIAVQDGQLLLNGQPVRLKGFCRHEDGGPFGGAVPFALMAKDVRLLKDMGCNCVRTSHYPNDPRFLDLCDQEGLLVWEEAHARGLSEGQMRSPCFLAQSEACVREMVAQHGNHPSIFTWGVLNECADDTEFGAECYEKLLTLLRALDPTRPVTAALLDRQVSRVLPLVDLVSFNLYPLWYHGADVAEHLAQMRAWAREHGGAGKPFIVSEIGAGGIYGYRDSAHPKWSEERQAEILRAQITAILADSGTTGVFLWQFADGRVDESWFDKRPKCENNKGVVDIYRRPKLAYQVVKELFTRG